MYAPTQDQEGSPTRHSPHSQYGVEPYKMWLLWDPALMKSHACSPYKKCTADEEVT